MSEFMLDCLKTYRDYRREYEETIAGFNEIVAELTAGFDQQVEELREKFQLEERKKKMLNQRAMVEALALRAFDETGNKTIYDSDGFKVRIVIPDDQWIKEKQVRITLPVIEQET